MWRVHSFRSSLFKPVWLLFIPSLLIRSWLLFCIYPYISFQQVLLSTALLIVLTVVTWYVASQLAHTARLSAHGAERFTVMSTLAMLTPPINVALQETLTWKQIAYWTTASSKTKLTMPTILNTLSAATNICILIIAVVSFLFALIIFIWRSKQKQLLFSQIRMLTAIPLLYSGCSACLIIIATLLRYPIPFLQTLCWLACPFLIASLFTTPYVLTQYTEQRIMHLPHSLKLHIAVICVMLLFFCSQFYGYILFATHYNNLH